MPDDRQSKKMPSTRISQQTGVSFGKLRMRVVGDLNIARRNMQIYPADHDNVQQSLSRVWRSITGLLKQVSPFSLSVSGEALTSGPHQIDPRGQGDRELAQVFKRAGMAAVEFTEGLEREELGRLIQLLIKDPSEAPGGDSLPGPIAASEFNHVKIYSFDYSQLEVTDEARISRSDSRPDSKIWDQFVNQLLVGNQGGGAANPGPSSDPVVLAGMLNQKMVDVDSAVECYTRLLRAQSDAETAGSPEIDVLGKKGLVGFSDLLQELHPTLREQFLSVTFDHCEALGDSQQAAWLLNGLGTEIIIQMLRYAKADGRKISPSLISLIQKLGGQPQANRQPFSAETEPKAMSSDGVQSLLRREDYDTYVDQDYDKLLQALAGRRYQAEPIDALSDTLAQGLDSTTIDCHIGHALTRLISISGDFQGYRDWARQLTLTLDDLVDDGAYDCLSDILSFTLEENGLQKDPEKKRVTGLVLNRFTDPQFLTDIILRIEHDPDTARATGAGLMGLIGDAALVEVLDALSPRDGPVQIQAKMNLLAPFGRRAALEALQRLNDPRPAYLCLMVRVIRWLGDAELVKGVRALIKHEHLDVRLEALGALLKFRNDWGLARLDDLTETGWSLETQKALELAAAYKVKEAVPMLVARLKRWGASEREQCRRLLASLGRIGDPGTLPILNKLARRRWTFSKKKLRYLQRCLFESLAGYPYPNVAGLIHIGLNHKDDHVRDTCRKLLEGFHRKTPSTGSSSPAAESS